MHQKVVGGTNGDVYYWTDGDDRRQECIVFTHGATMDHNMFRHQFDEFRQRWRVVVWDVPTHGRSRPYVNFSLDDSADQLAAILDAENVDAAHLVGQSMGGYISQIFSKKYPTRTLSVVSVGSTPLSRKYFSSLDLWLLSITPGLLKVIPYPYLIRAIASQVALSPDARNYALATLQSYEKWEIGNIMGSVYDGVKAYGKELITPPALLITYGDKDKTGKVKSYCAKWSAEEGWPLEVIGNAAHNCNMDNPQAFNRILAAFLESQSN